MQENTATLLVVDDELIITELLSRWLTGEGYRCFTAKSGDDALKILAEQPVDCVLSDVNMPGMSGIELLSVCRQRYAETVVIMVSAVDDREIVMRALELGAFSYLLKPFEKIEVLLHVANALRVQQLERERREHYRGLLEIFLERNKALQEAYAELQRLNLELRHQEKLASLGQLAAGVAHELSNPLAFVAGNLGQLEQYGRRLIDYAGRLEKLAAPAAADEIQQLRLAGKIDFVVEDYPELLAQTRDGIERIRELVGDITEFSRRDRQEMENADIEKLLDTAFAIAHNELKHRATVTKRYGSPPPVRCRPGQLVQVFVNLLTNAAQAMEERGVITVTTGVENDQVVVRVADTGRGIAPADLERIFEPFFTTRHHGTGLGLAISRDIVRDHGGTITVTSTLGCGSIFTVTLPPAAESASKSE